MKKVLIRCIGHPNISATHKTTFELTKAKEISKRANCIIGTRCDKASFDIGSELCSLINKKRCIIILELESAGVKDQVVAWLSPAKALRSTHSAVVRKSNYVCPRTLAVMANKAAIDLDRRLIKKLAERETLNVIIKIPYRFSID